MAARSREDRAEARRTAKRDAVQGRVDELRREGRAWFYRGVLALLVAVPLAFVVTLLTAVAVGLALFCFYKGTTFGFRANELLDGGSPDRVDEA